MPSRFSEKNLGEIATSLQDVGSLLRLALRQAAPKVEAWMAELTE